MNDPDFQRRLQLADMLRGSDKIYYPLFSGKSEDGGKVVIYIHMLNDTLHIVRPDGEFWALSPGAVIEDHWDVDRYIYTIKVTSPEWTGTAKGSRVDLLEEPVR